MKPFAQNAMFRMGDFKEDWWKLQSFDNIRARTSCRGQVAPAGRELCFDSA